MPPPRAPDLRGPTSDAGADEGTPLGVEETECFEAGDLDTLEVALDKAGLGKDDRTRKIFKDHDVDVNAFHELRERDMADLGLRKGAMLKVKKYLTARRATANRDADDPPEFLTCPLSLELFVDPVLLLVDGQTYDRADITAWIDQHANSPLTRQAANLADLVPNRAILDAADAFRAGWGRPSPDDD